MILFKTIMDAVVSVKRGCIVIKWMNLIISVKLTVLFLLRWGSMCSSWWIITLLSCPSCSWPFLRWLVFVGSTVREIWLMFVFLYRHCATFELFRRQALNRIAKCLILTGVKNLSSNLLEMTGKRPNIFFRVCWWVICPVLITVSVIVTAFLKPQPGLVLELNCVSVSLRLSWCSRWFSSSQRGMRITFTRRGLRVWDGSSLWPPSSGFL